MKRDVLFLVAGVVKTVDAVEMNAIRAVPEQTLLAMCEIEIDVDPAAFEWQGHGHVFIPGLLDDLAVLDCFSFLWDLREERRARRFLLLRRAPRRLDFAGRDGA